MFWLVFILVGMLLILIDLLMHPHTFSLFLVFPVIVGEGGILSVIGIILIFVGIMLAFLSPFSSTRKTRSYNLEHHYEPNFEEKYEDKLEYDKMPEKETSWGGLVLIGPVPIFFGSFKGSKYAKYITPIAILLGITFAILAVMYVLKYYLP